MKRIKEAEERSGKDRELRFKVIEPGGVSLKAVLQKSNPWSGEPCERTDCFPCTSGEKGGDCARSSVTYRIVCLKCADGAEAANYIGETGRNAYTRGQQHLQLLKNKSTDSPLWSHCMEHHGSERAEFRMKVMASFQKCLRRQIMEGEEIQEFSGLSMNRKSEWRGPAVARAAFTREVRDAGGETGAGRTE